MKEHLQRLEEGLAKEDNRIPINDLLSVNKMTIVNGGGRGEIERLNTPVEGMSPQIKTNSKKTKFPVVNSKKNGVIFKKKKEKNFTPRKNTTFKYFEQQGEVGSSPILKLRQEKVKAKTTWDPSASSPTSPQMAGQSEPNQTSSKPPCGTTLGLGSTD